MSSPFASLQELRDRPLPLQEPLLEKRKGYRNYPLNLNDPRHKEPLVDLKKYNVAGENFYHITRNPPYYRLIEGSIPQLYVRQSVAEKLVQVQKRLAEANLELWIHDAWRPTAVQSYFYHQWMPDEVRRRHPGLSPDQVEKEVEKYWSKPTESASSPAPHFTGGAVDCELRWKNGQSLWFGSLFDDVTTVSNTGHFEPHSPSPLCGRGMATGQGEGFSFSDENARANRRLLYWVMIEAGFVNLPTEWWHFSYGDQMWAKFQGVPAAFYGGVAFP